MYKRQTSGRFGFGLVQFWFRVKIGSGLSDVGSGPISGHSVRFIRFGSILPGLVEVHRSSLK